MRWMIIYWIFFFQAEDGIRDIGVTGVQTCALPIFASLRIAGGEVVTRDFLRAELARLAEELDEAANRRQKLEWARQIGRASWRERVEISGVDGSFKKKRRKSTVA